MAGAANIHLAHWQEIFEDSEAKDEENQVPKSQKIKSSKTGVDFIQAECDMREIKVSTSNKLAQEFFTIKIWQELSSLGLGACVWDCAFWLSHFLAANPHLLDAKKVIELGSGTGLVGICAWLIGRPDEVCLTDLESLGSLINLNIEENCSNLNMIMSSCPQQKGAISFQSYRWGNEEELALLNPPYDLVLCADCLYEQEALEPFKAALRQLCRPRTLVLFAHKKRLPRQEIGFFTELAKFMEIRDIQPLVTDQNGCPCEVDSLYLLAGSWCEREDMQKSDGENNNRNYDEILKESLGGLGLCPVICELPQL